MLRKQSKFFYPLVLLSIFLIATNLRAPVTVLGPLLSNLGEQFNLNASALGFITTLPVLAFGFFSPIANWLSEHIGLIKSLFFGLLLILIGYFLRFLPFTSTLYIGTLIIGLGIAIGNVLLPPLIKTFFPTKVALITAIYVFLMGGMAGISSSLMAPMIEDWGFSNQQALSSFAIFTIFALIICIPILNATNSNLSQSSIKKQKTNIWIYRLAWYITLFSGINSAIYYSIVTWLPDILQSLGMSNKEAGNIQGVMQLGTALPGFIIVPLIHYFKDQRLIGFLIAITSVISFLALIYLPNLAYLWGFLIGLSNGGVLLLGLIYAGIKCSKPAQVAALAAMMQFIGYVIAAIAPPIFGSLKDFTGNWHITLWSFVVMSAIVTYFVYLSSGKQLIKQ